MRRHLRRERLLEVNAQRVILPLRRLQLLLVPGARPLKLQQLSLELAVELIAARAEKVGAKKAAKKKAKKAKGKKAKSKAKVKSKSKTATKTKSAAEDA